MAATRAASAVSIPGRVVKNDCGSGAEEPARGGCDDGVVCSGCRCPEGGSTVTAPLGCCAGGGMFSTGPRCAGGGPDHHPTSWLLRRVGGGYLCGPFRFR